MGTDTETAAQTGWAIMREFLKVSPFVGHLGIRLVRLEPDFAELLLPFSEPLITIGDTVHGGAISTLVDTAAMAAAWSTESPPANLRGTTVALNVSFTTAARSVDLTAKARVVRRGKNLCACDVDVTDPNGELVAKGLVTYKLG
ncbi:MAG: PaaI family thioesterase [Actinomycetota bacterium]